MPEHVREIVEGVSRGTTGGEVRETLEKMVAYVDATATEEEEEKARMEFVSGDLPSLLAGKMEGGGEGGMVAAAAYGVAELAKGKRFREVVGSDAGPGVVASVVAAVAAAENSSSLGDDESETLIQLMRAVGNMSYYNDKNREVLHGCGLGAGLLGVVGLLDGMDSRLALVTMGALGNYIASDANTYVEDVGGLEIVPFILSGMDVSCSFGMKMMATRAFLATWYDATWEHIHANLNIMDILLALVSDQDAEQSCVYEALSTVTNQAVVAREVATNKALLATLMATASSRDEDDEDAAAAAASTLANLALVDELVPILVEENVVTTFCSLVAAPPGTGSPLAVRKAIMLLLGNMARSDDRCLALRDAGFVEASLFNLALIADNDEELSLQHAILGSLRNLAISGPCRDALRDSGLIPALLPILNSPHQPMQFNAAAILRHLIKHDLDAGVGAPSAALAAAAAGKVAGQAAYVEALIKLSASDAVNVKMEACRALAFLSMYDESKGGTFQTVDEMTFCVPLISSQFDVLRKEGMAALESGKASGIEGLVGDGVVDAVNVLLGRAPPVDGGEDGEEGDEKLELSESEVGRLEALLDA